MAVHKLLDNATTDGVGVPFPEYRSTKQGKRRVFVD